MKYQSVNLVEFESDLTKQQARECIKFAKSCDVENFDLDEYDHSDLDPLYELSARDMVHDMFWDTYWEYFKCIKQVEKSDSSGHTINEDEVTQFASKLLEFIYQYLGFNDTEEQIASACGKKRKEKQTKDIPWSKILDSCAEAPMSRLLYDATYEQNYDVLFSWFKDVSGPRGMMSITVKKKGIKWGIQITPPEDLVKKASFLIPQFETHKVVLSGDEICFVKYE